MRLDKVQDPRNPIEKLSRKECEYVARFMNIREIEPGMPQPLMVEILRKNNTQFRSIVDKGLGQRRSPLPPYEEWVRIISGAPSKPAQREEVKEIDKLALMKADFQASKGTLILEDLPFFKLRRLCSDRGIKWELTDKKVTLLEKLNNDD